MIHPASRYIIIGIAAALSALGQSVNGSAIFGAGYLLPAPINVAPGQIITVFATGVGSTLTAPVLARADNLPTSLAGISVTIRQGTDLPAPILQVVPMTTCQGCGAITAITIQIPYELRTGCSVPVNVCADPALLVQTVFFVTENGVAGTSAALNPLADSVHILTLCDTLASGSLPYAISGAFPCQPVVTHSNGMLVSRVNPARAGEELVAYAVGLGATNPAVPTGQPATEPTLTAETFLLDFNFHANALASQPPQALPINPLPFPLFSGLTPGYPGLYQINFIVPTVPSGLPACAFGQGFDTSNLTVSVGGSASFDGAAICVSLPG